MAILKRRKPRGAAKKIREVIWPSMGWIRTFHYFRHRIFRTGDSTYKITAGLASGVAVSFTPFLGTHFIQAALLSWLLGANIVAGFVGTAIGNPWTFPLMFIAEYKTGIWICGLFGLEASASLPAEFSSAGFIAEASVFVQNLLSNPISLFLPMAVGGFLCAVLVWPFSYILLYYPVRAARRAYRLQRMARRKKRRGKKVEKHDTGYRV